MTNSFSLSGGIATKVFYLKIPFNISSYFFLQSVLQIIIFSFIILEIRVCLCFDECAIFILASHSNDQEITGSKQTQKNTLIFLCIHLYFLIYFGWFSVPFNSIAVSFSKSTSQSFWEIFVCTLFQCPSIKFI